MGNDLITLIEIDFRQFTFSKIRLGLFNEIPITLSQYETLLHFLSEAKPEIEKITGTYAEPEVTEMEMMGVRREEVGYRSIEIAVLLDEKTHLLQDWHYRVAFLTKDEQGNPGMKFGDRQYTRAEVQAL